MFVQLYMKVSNFAEAEKYLTELINRNQEKREYYFKLADCVGASCDQNRLHEFYQVMQKTFPRAKVRNIHSPPLLVRRPLYMLN